MDRTQRRLAALLALQLALLLLLHNPFMSRAAGDQPLLQGLGPATPEKLEIDDGKGASVTLERQSGSWTLEKPEGYPATADKIEKLIKDLEALKASRPVVSSRRHHAALKVADDDFERRVRIWKKAGGEPSFQLYVGSSPGYGTSHVRVGGKDRVYEVSGPGAYDLPADAGSWIDRNLVHLGAEEVTDLEVTNRKGGFALEKKNGAWRVRAPAARSSAALDPTQVESLIRTFCDLSLTEPVGRVDEKAQGLADPEARLALRHALTAADSARLAPAEVEVRIGALVPGKTDERYATRSGLGYAVTLAKYSTERALGVTLAELLRKP